MPTPVQTFEFRAALHEFVKYYPMMVEQQRGTLRFQRGYDTFELEYGAVLDDFRELGVDVKLVAQAVAALALDKLGFIHGLGNHGLTLAICGRTESDEVRPRTTTPRYSDPSVKESFR